MGPDNKRRAFFIVGVIYRHPTALKKRSKKFQRNSRKDIDENIYGKHKNLYLRWYQYWFEETHPRVCFLLQNVKRSIFQTIDTYNYKNIGLGWRRHFYRSHLHKRWKPDQCRYYKCKKENFRSSPYTLLYWFLITSASSFKNLGRCLFYRYSIFTCPHFGPGA